jgi:hypothetical protein
MIIKEGQKEKGENVQHTTAIYKGRSSKIFVQYTSLLHDQSQYTEKIARNLTKFFFLSSFIILTFRVAIQQASNNQANQPEACCAFGCLALNQSKPSRDRAAIHLMFKSPSELREG